MRRRTAGLPTGFLKWIGQIAASIAATAVASMIYAALPKIALPAPPPVAELTSGGKFAARVPGAAEATDVVALPAAAPLGAAPLTFTPAAPPRLLLPAITDITLPALPVSAPASDWDAAAHGGPAIAEKPIKLPKAGRSAVRSEVRRDGDTGSAEIRRTQVYGAALPKPTYGVTLTGLPAEAAIPKAEDGLLPKMLSSAQSLVSMAAQAGGSLLSRLVP